MFLVPLLLIILIIWFFVYFFRSPQSNSNANAAFSNTSHSNASPDNKAIEILNERYAKGEISEDEYLKIKRNLEK